MSEATKKRMKVSREGIVLIKSFAGFRARAVQDDHGRWRIGYGHTASAREGLTISERDAELLLQYDLLPVVRAINAHVRTDLNQHQFDALASFALSVGVVRFLGSDVLRRLNDGAANEAAEALIGWPEPTPPDAALRRRAAERALFVAEPGASVRLAELLTAPLPVREAAPAAAMEARVAAVATLLGEPSPDAPAAPAPATPEAAPGATPPAANDMARSEGPGPQPNPPPPAGEAADDAEPLAGFPDALLQQRFSPYGVAMVGRLPELDTGEIDAASMEITVVPALDLAMPGEAAPEPETPPDPADLDPFPGTDPGDPAPEPAVEDATPSFEHEPGAPVVRHEQPPRATVSGRWAGSGAYLVMAALGLAACAFSAAGFRLAASDASPMGETAVVAWTLALIGFVCVAVSSWSLYRRLSRSQRG